jgi:hypothetical protein
LKLNCLSAVRELLGENQQILRTWLSHPSTSEISFTVNALPPCGQQVSWRARKATQLLRRQIVIRIG